MPKNCVVGVILAGGRARRMGGGDKTMLALGGRTILERVVSRFRPQCDEMLLNANGDPRRFAALDLVVVADGIADFPGPLAGVLAALDWTAGNRPDAKWVASAAGDCPFLPFDFVSRLQDARTRPDARLAVAQSGEQRHFVSALWPVDLREDLRDALFSGVRRIELWTGRYPVAVANWSSEPFDPFFNVNTPEDLTAARQLISRRLDGAAMEETA